MIIKVHIFWECHKIWRYVSLSFDFTTIFYGFLRKRQIYKEYTLPERIYKPITAMGVSAMFTFQLDNTKR